jgi:iron transport multicopper oxidase
MFNDYHNHGTFNNSVYMFPKVPPIFSAMTMGIDAENASTYGPWTHTTVLPHNQNIQLAVVSHDLEGNHPFHLHGHTFQVVGKGFSGGFDLAALQPGFDALKNPMQRDTVVIPKRGWVVLRFRAGYFFYNCR